MLIRLLCRKTAQKETPNSPMNGGWGVEVSKTLFYPRWYEDSKKDWKAEMMKDTCVIYGRLRGD